MTITFLQTTGRTVRFVAAAIPVCAALALPSPASAQIDPGVNYDPSSPAGKEYAIPLVLGRAEGAGTEDQRAAANTAFGVGITPPAGGGAGEHGRGERGGSGSGAGKSRSGSAGGGASQPLTAADRTRLAQAEEPAGTGTWTLGIWLAVLLPAALIALLLRGGRSQPTPRPSGW